MENVTFATSREVSISTLSRGGSPIALSAGEGELIGTSVVKADRPEVSLIEFEIKPGGGVQPHFHKGHSDSFYVLEGEVEFHVGDEVVHGLQARSYSPLRESSISSRTWARAGESPEPPYARRLRGVPAGAPGSPSRRREAGHRVLRASRHLRRRLSCGLESAREEADLARARDPGRHKGRRPSPDGCRVLQRLPHLHHDEPPRARTGAGSERSTPSGGSPGASSDLPL